MKAARDRDEEFYDPAQNVPGRTKNRLELWEEHLKDPVAALLPTDVDIWFHRLSLSSLVFVRTFSNAGAHFCKSCGKGPVGKGFGHS